jgi:hypothetical protein
MTLTVVNLPTTNLNVTNDVKQIVRISAPGPQGPRGITGDTGPVGSDLTYLHTQSVPASTWTVVHNLGKFPSTTIFDSTGDIVAAPVNYVDTSTAIISFSGATAGRAVFN